MNRPNSNIADFDEAVFGSLWRRGDAAFEQELAPYRAAKGALAQFSETLRAEVMQFGIRVLEIMPGGVTTGLAASSIGTGKLWQRSCEIKHCDGMSCSAESTRLSLVNNDR